MRKSKRPALPRNDGPTGSEPLPPEIADLIDGKTRTVKIPQLDRFFAKKWTTMVDAVQKHEHVTVLQPNEMLLQPDFFRRFSLYLRTVLGRKNRFAHVQTPSEFISQALCSAAEEFLPNGQQSVEVTAPIPTIWPNKRPLAEAWEPRDISKSLSLPKGEIVFDCPSEGGIKRASGERQQQPRLGMRVSLNSEACASALPELTISIRGDGIWSLLRCATPFAAAADDKKRAEQIWNELSNSIMVCLNLRRSGRGRPKSAQGFSAAFLRHYKRLQWNEVAEMLCKENHEHDFHCRENFRKQAEQFWKDERDKYQKLGRSLSTSSGHTQSRK